ncbi:uncharacterized protein [Ptychodera flava]|uniref:uncharacterized protein isoform X2 n=1 Tax=Ptychodera flava TaxID=63121 RepID=UPI00396A7BED
MREMTGKVSTRLKLILSLLLFLQVSNCESYGEGSEESYSSDMDDRGVVLESRGNKPKPVPASFIPMSLRGSRVLGLQDVESNPQWDDKEDPNLREVAFKRPSTGRVQKVPASNTPQIRRGSVTWDLQGLAPYLQRDDKDDAKSAKPFTFVDDAATKRGQRGQQRLRNQNQRNQDGNSKIRTINLPDYSAPLKRTDSGEENLPPKQSDEEREEFIRPQSETLESLAEIKSMLRDYLSRDANPSEGLSLRDYGTGGTADQAQKGVVSTTSAWKRRKGRKHRIVPLYDTNMMLRRSGTGVAGVNSYQGERDTNGQNGKGTIPASNNRRPQPKRIGDQLGTIIHRESGEENEGLSNGEISRGDAADIMAEIKGIIDDMLSEDKDQNQRAAPFQIPDYGGSIILREVSEGNQEYANDDSTNELFKSPGYTSTLLRSAFGKWLENNFNDSH